MQNKPDIPITLEQYNKRILESSIKNYWVKNGPRILNEIEKIYSKMPKLTRWQKFKNYFRNWGHRIVAAYKVLMEYDY